MNRSGICFSYCLYGTFKPKYYLGLEENIKYILLHFPLSLIYLWFGSDVEDQYFDKYNSHKNVKIFKLNITGHILMSYRFTTIDFPGIDIVFIRDADSRITDRELKCNKEFIKSSYLLHTIRDHKGHFVPLMGGLSAIKKKLIQIKNINITNIIKSYTQQNIRLDYYNSDQNLLQELFYNNFRNQLLVHSTKNIFNDPHFIKLQPPKDNNFCGQVIDYDENLKPFEVHQYQNYD